MIRFIAKVTLLLLVLFIGWAIYLDIQVVEKFSGKKWSVPAKVYAQPFEMFVGGELKATDLRQELDRLGYREEYQAREPGTYHLSPDQTIIHTRGFQFWDTNLPSKRIEIFFYEGQVEQMINLNDQSREDLVRLEPMLIGGIHPQHNEDRILVDLETVPPLLIDGLIAVEDRRFAEHMGISVRGIVRAIKVNVAKGGFAQGGSTLTQQLVKNFYLTSERTLRRKAQEAVMAILLDLHYSKQEILEAYLNEVYLGQRGEQSIHGFGLASQFYFGRPLSELKPHHIALLIGMVKGPSSYNPRRKPELALSRRNQVLDIMLDQNLITIDDYDKFGRRSLGVLDQTRYKSSNFPAFMELVKQQLSEDYQDEHLKSDGMRIFTTMQPSTQFAAEQAMQTRFKQFKQQSTREKLQGAIVVTQPQTGEVLALVGDANPRYPGFNRALKARRPIGSVIKPFVYLTALKQGYTLASPIEDLPIDMRLGGKQWQPQNFDKTSHGVVWLIDALANSYNLATARLGLDIGVRHVATTLEQAANIKDVPHVAAMLLGAVELSPFTVASAYQTLASGGFRSELSVIREVLDAYGEPLNRYPLQMQQVFDSDDIFLLTTAMQRVMSDGTGRRAYDKLPAELELAGKTGTSDDLRDAWFVGFSGNYLAVVWLGNDDNSPMGLTGSSGALPIWTDLMAQLPQRPLVPLMSDNISYQWVDVNASVVTEPNCPGALPIPMRSDLLKNEPIACRDNGRPPGWIERMLKNFDGNNTGDE